MRVLVVSSKFPPEYSGSGLRAHRTYQRLQRSYGVDYDVVCNSTAHNGVVKYEYDGVQVQRVSHTAVSWGSTGWKRKARILFQVVREGYHSWRFIRSRSQDYDLVHTFGNSWSVAFFTLYFGFLGKPIVRELCNEMDSPFYPPQVSWVIQKLFGRPNTLFVAISPRLEDVCKRFGIERVWQRPNPVDDRFHIRYSEKEALRRKFTRFSDDDILLAAVAAFIPRKNHAFLLDVVQRLPARYKLLLAGPRKEEHRDTYPDLRAEIDDRGLADRVDLQSGFVDNIEDYIVLSDVFLFPSLAEGLGTPILEAQACGVPVVASLIPGITDKVIEKGDGGFAVPLDAEEFAAAIQQATDIPRPRLVKNSKRVFERASSAVIDRQYYSLLQELTQNQRVVMS